MIANNENGRAPEALSVTPPVVIATAGRGAVNHYLEDSTYLAQREAVTLARIREHEGDDQDEDGPMSFDDRRDYYTEGRYSVDCEPDADGGLPCPVCGLAITLAARVHCATCSC